MKRVPVFFLLLLLTASPLFADRAVDLTGWVSWVDPNSEGTFDLDAPNDDFDVNFDGEMGYGLGVNIFWTERLSTEFAVSRVNSPIQLTGRGRAVNIAGGDLEMMPVTGILQFHFAPNAFIDPYIGAGAAYIVLGDVDDAGDVNNLALDQIESDDIGLVINGGLSIALGRNLAIVGDVKYVPVGSSAKAVLNDAAGTETGIDINPVIFSAGLSLRF